MEQSKRIIKLQEDLCAAVAQNVAARKRKEESEVAIRQWLSGLSEEEFINEYQSVMLTKNPFYNCRAAVLAEMDRRLKEATWKRVIAEQRLRHELINEHRGTLKFKPSTFYEPCKRCKGRRTCKSTPIYYASRIPRAPKEFSHFSLNMSCFTCRIRTITTLSDRTATARAIWRHQMLPDPNSKTRIRRRENRENHKKFLANQQEKIILSDDTNKH